MLDPTSDEAYAWPADSNQPSYAQRWVTDYDRAHEPFEATDLSPYIGFVQRFIVGVDPATDPDDLPLHLDSQVIWQIPEPMTIQTRNLSPELLEILYGQAVVPLCHRQIPTEGTE